MDSKSMPLTNLFTKDNSSEIYQMLKAIFENTIDGIIAINEKGVIEAVNSSAAILFGYESKEVIGHKINMLMPEPHRSGHDKYLDNYHQTGHAKIIGIGREVKGLRKDGSTFPFRLSVSEVKTSDRRLYTGFIHDVSDLNEAKKQLEKMNMQLEKLVEQRTEELSNVITKVLKTNKQLEYEVKERKAAEAALKRSEQEIRASYKKEKELGELKSRFVSIASHEFRTPLTTINSSASILARYILTEQQGKREKHVTKIQNSVSHLTNILNDFLSLGKLEEGIIEVNIAQIIWRDFCTEMLDGLQASLKKGQFIDCQAPSEDIVIESDKRLLKNIFFNLVSNAIKYSHEDSTIIAHATIENHLLVVSIKDQGIGIPKEEQQHLFTRFFRANNVDNIQGTGLGLTIVKRYLDLLKGDISFESAEGRGSTFIVKIPMKV